MVALGDVSSIDRKVVSPDRIKDGTTYLGLEHLKRGGRIAGHETIGDFSVASAKHSFTEEHILFGKLRPNLGKIARPAFSGICSTDILPIKTGGQLERSFLFHYLSQDRTIDHAASRASGANLPRISPAELLKFPVPLPPLDEQRRITAILDRSARYLSATSHYSKLISEFERQSFVKLFGRPLSWADRWPMAKVGDIVDSTQYGTSEKSSTFGPTPVLRMGNLTVDGRLEISDLKYMTLAEKNRSKHTVRRGDILFNRTNSPDLVGKTAVVRTDDEYAYAGYLIRIRVSEDADPEFVSGYLNSEYGKILLRSMCKSIVGQANINAKELRSISIAVPPRALQNKFAELVAKAEEVRGRIDERGRVLESLHASLRSRAFRGEL